ncbi:MAG: TetR/AcrR family transcriptional regulator [Gammaproteobacteria bacterium]|nr:TetR/AcrR family transcriptional regulator [Gammaproteobacteria bacterium]NND38675.1 TetR/AcrR family transcriptional regulator [Pseudomonadales bacterium]MBT8151011.1 TetR/AcrR family transcriptional regulator [Gammaproteobacteria bacterium]NNL11356.1 TetR/AcrR family transcriptional regulator [Pseudomonadales bacterium]NNM11021.1 TetR/AcrR family transcriptional regulator [Pseudomonadales bacterium]
MTIQRSAKAEYTRERILEVAGEEMRRVGYRAMGLNDILHKLRMSKGALYHHFRNKLELGYAVLDELYAKSFLKTWDSPLDRDDPLQAIISYLQAMSENMSDDMLSCGCPINNLANEMSNLDEGFRLRVEGLFERWKARMTSAFARAQKNGFMREDVDAEDTAVFVIAAVQGAIMLAKNAQDASIFSQATQSVSTYLSGLQTQAGKASVKSRNH